MAVSSDHKVVGIIQGNEKYLRIKTLLNHAAYELYCKLFLDPNYGGFSRQPDTIYKELLEYKPAVETLKKNGEINSAEFLTIYPPSEETYLRECELSLLHKLCLVCIKKFPIIKNATKIDPNEESFEKIFYMKRLEKLQTIIQDGKLQKLVNNSETGFASKWTETTDILRSVAYDVTKVSEIKTTDDLDSCKSCHAAFMRSQTEILLHECNNFLRSSEVNTITLNRLINNLKEAFALEGKTDDDTFPLKEMKDLRESIEITINMLNITKESLLVLFPDLKFWKDKNIEGDIIIIDEMMNKLSIQIEKQCRCVSDYFNTVSFDIVKIKEKVNSQDENNLRYVRAPDVDPKEKKISLGFVSIGF